MAKAKRKVKKMKVKKKRRAGKGYLSKGSKLLSPEMKQQLVELADSPAVSDTLLEDVETFLGKLYSKNKKRAKLLAKTTLPYEWPKMLDIGIGYFKKRSR